MAVRCVYRSLFLLLVLPLFISCGWQLRGKLELPAAMSTTYIDTAAKTGALSRYLTRALRAADIVVIDEPADNAAILTVKTRSGRDASSIGPDGKVREYEVYVHAEFSIVTQDGLFELPAQKIKLSRSQLFDPLEVLAASTEQRVLIDDMERQLAGLILDRIEAAYNKSPVASQNKN